MLNQQKNIFQRVHHSSVVLVHPSSYLNLITFEKMGVIKLEVSFFRFQLNQGFADFPQFLGQTGISGLFGDGLQLLRKEYAWN